MAKEKRNATTAWLERSNPLRGLTIAQANTIFDCARNGDTQRLHWMYQEIEAQNPVLSMATTRRAGAAANFKWRITERASMDGSLSSEQKDAAERFFAEIDNFSDVFEHLDLALFRGFAHAQPIWDGNRVQHVELIDSWKFLKKDGEWLFNPACDGFSSNCVSCKDARLITIERRRPVDVPALAIHLREAVGSRDWGRFIERYALPKPAVVMAPNATKKDREDYEDSAVALENGQVTVWPSGASLMDFAGSSRPRCSVRCCAPSSRRSSSGGRSRSTSTSTSRSSRPRRRSSRRQLPRSPPATSSSRTCWRRKRGGNLKNIPLRRAISASRSPLDSRSTPRPPCKTTSAACKTRRAIQTGKETPWRDPPLKSPEIGLLAQTGSSRRLHVTTRPPQGPLKSSCRTPRRKLGGHHRR